MSPSPLAHHHRPVAFGAAGLALADRPSGKMEEDILQAGFTEVDAGYNQAFALGKKDDLGDPPFAPLHGQDDLALVEVPGFDPVDIAEFVQERDAVAE